MRGASASRATQMRSVVLFCARCLKSRSRAAALENFG